MNGMSFTVSGVLAALFLLIGILGCVEIGRRVGIHRMRKDPDAHQGVRAVEGAVFGLLSLLIAFTIYGAAERLDKRRELLVEETNRIAEAWRRIDLLAPADQPAVREIFRQYLDSRLDLYRKLRQGKEAAAEEMAISQKLQNVVWQKSLAAAESQSASKDATRLLVPALNQMIEITTDQAMALRMHPPTIIFVMLFGVSFASSLLAGYSMASASSHNWLYTFCFAAVLAVSVYVIIDLEYPRLGLIRVDSFDQALVDLRHEFN